MLLAEGIGDTIRVSLTADPREEVWAAYEILRAAGRRSRGVELVSCPTCGRCEIQLQELAEEVDRELRGIEQPLKVAVMGCVVNGPGEARDAGIGIAGGRGFGLLFKGGQVIAKVENNRMASALIDAARETAKRREMVEDDTALVPTLREEPSDTEVISHKLLVRAGMIRKVAGGVYTYLPLAFRVLQKINQIVREEMNRAGGQEVGLPIMQPRELWDQTGRWQLYGDEMFRLKDRHQRDFCLGPTHEEVITALVNAEVHSYRDLPLLLYQIQDKFRDEIRPRFGLMRGREFIMKDLYSFDVDEDGLEISYRKMYFAYTAVFERLGLDFRVVEADSGAIGGSSSHEFIVLARSGESVIVYCDQCDYAANVEKAEAVFEPVEKVEECPPLNAVPTRVKSQ